MGDLLTCSYPLRHKRRAHETGADTSSPDCDAGFKIALLRLS